MFHIVIAALIGLIAILLYEPEKRYLEIFGAKEVLHHVIVDTLNLCHWAYNKISRELIVTVIKKASLVLRKLYDDRIMFVFKDRDHGYFDPSDSKFFDALAKETKTYIYVVEKSPLHPDDGKNKDHWAKGRDDLYISMLAKKWKCSVLSEDRYHGIKEGKVHVKPFYVDVHNYWKADIEREFYKPELFHTMSFKRPKRIPFDEVFKREDFQ